MSQVNYGLKLGKGDYVLTKIGVLYEDQLSGYLSMKQSGKLEKDDEQLKLYNLSNNMSTTELIVLSVLTFACESITGSLRNKSFECSDRVTACCFSDGLFTPRSFYRSMLGLSLKVNDRGFRLIENIPMINEFEYENVDDDQCRSYLRYKIDDSKKAKEIYRRGKNSVYEKTVKEALKKAGFELQIKDGYLTLFLDVGSNLISSTRMAGRKPCRSGVKFSEVIYMQQTLKVKDIIEKLGMSKSSYTRHNRKMKNSYYYKQLDQSRLNDEEYLQSVDGNSDF